jgi:DinB superfamily
MTHATTSTIAAPVAMIFSFNDDMVFRALEGLTPSQLWQRPTERNNPMLWVAGHLVQTRATVLQLLGEQVETGWGQLFDRGATIVEADQYPSRDEIERVMREVSPRLHSKLASLDDSSLARPGSMSLPFARTLADELAFFALHDAYTVGQMGYIRKALGYPGIAG